MDELSLYFKSPASFGKNTECEPSFGWIRRVDLNHRSSLELIKQKCSKEQDCFRVAWLDLDPRSLTKEGPTTGITLWLMGCNSARPSNTFRYLADIVSWLTVFFQTFPGICRQRLWRGPLSGRPRGLHQPPGHVEADPPRGPELDEERRDLRQTRCRQVRVLV